MKTLQVLHVEDSVFDSELVVRELKKAGLKLFLKRVDSKSEFQQALKEFDMDIILCDHSMYQFNSIEALNLFKEANIDVPFILVTGSVSEEFAVTILKDGADDYIIKDNLTRLPTAVISALEKKEAEQKRIQAEKMILQAYRMAEGVMEAAPDCIIGINESHAIVLTNKKTETLFGYTRGELLQLSPTAMFPNLNSTLGLKNVFLNRKSFEQLDCIGTRKNQTTFPAEVSTSFVDSDQGTIMIISVRDITTWKNSKLELQELNEALESNARKLREINGELEQYAYVVSHELQEPIRMVSSFLTLLKKELGDGLSAKSEKFLHYAVDGANRMRKIVYDLLDYSRIGRTRESLEQVNLNSILSEVISLYRKQILDTKARIESAPLPVIQTYPTLVSLVFQNLLSNALKFVKKDTSPYIVITCEEHELEWKLSVQDNGIGLDPEYYDRIFELMQRVNPEGFLTGTGVGLSITKKVIEQLGGKIWITANPVGGTIFHFTISKGHPHN
jgi:PAS domain S-box-containing protein